MLNTDVVVIPVICSGDMPKESQAAFAVCPEALPKYLSAVSRRELSVGKCHAEWLSDVAPRWAVFLPVRQSARHSVCAEHLREGIASLVDVVEENAFHSIAIVPFDCPQARVRWSNLQRMLSDALATVGGGIDIEFLPAPPRAGSKPSY